MNNTYIYKIKATANIAAAFTTSLAPEHQFEIASRLIRSAIPVPRVAFIQLDGRLRYSDVEVRYGHIVSPDLIVAVVGLELHVPSDGSSFTRNVKVAAVKNQVLADLRSRFGAAFNPEEEDAGVKITPIEITTLERGICKPAEKDAVVEEFLKQLNRPLSGSERREPVFVSGRDFEFFQN